MNKKTVNIAVIVSGIDEEYQNTILKGIQDFASKHNINVSNFIAYGGILKSQKYDVGEYNIYELVNFAKFDGVILLTNTIASTEVTEKIVARVKEAGIPTVSIDNNIDGFYYIGIDNFSAMEVMVRHIVEHHGARKINYISGPDNNPESILRLQAYKNVLEENNIEIEEERIYHGLFRGSDGREAVRAFLKSDLEFPEAIICANDAMALSAVIELEKYGKNVPSDVLVTGFDSIYAAQNYAPEISSVTRPLKQSGALACKIIYDHINGCKSNQSNILPTEYIFAESCGCPNQIIDDISQFKKSNYRALETYNIYVPLINRMSCELEECVTLEENISVIKELVKEIKCEKFFLCMCENWNIDYDDSDNYTVNGYTENVYPIVSYINGNFIDYKEFKSLEMLPELFKDSVKSSVYYFMPIHFREHCLGYCVVCNCSFPMESALYHTWVMNISNSLENIRKIICLDRMVARLDQMSVIDPLVQIYNRNGLNKNTRLLYDECINKQLGVMIMFIDMDNLKYINDKFGHNEGDFALKSIAEALKNASDDSGRQVCARFGGDEFIIFAADADENTAIKINRKIEDYLDNVNRISEKPYEVHASIGYYITKANNEQSLYNLITIADKIMYENKKKRKALEAKK
ncbi:substrate-binding and GGDEF domain-containing protein [Porcipelethomonas sp.]|uniref:substrate-binding and GGDEF domain-containing protein n=1 Tax=Porcipelethomonas sp. TaxID=2981675 RepID=UPI003EF5BAFD